MDSGLLTKSAGLKTRGSSRHTQECVGGKGVCVPLGSGGTGREGSDGMQNLCEDVDICSLMYVNASFDLDSRERLVLL